MNLVHATSRIHSSCFWLMVLLACSVYEEGSLTIVRLPVAEVGNPVRGGGGADLEF